MNDTCNVARDRTSSQEDGERLTQGGGGGGTARSDSRGFIRFARCGPDMYLGCSGFYLRILPCRTVRWILGILRPARSRSLRVFPIMRLVPAAGAVAGRGAGSERTSGIHRRGQSRPIDLVCQDTRVKPSDQTKITLGWGVRPYSRFDRRERAGTTSADSKARPTHFFATNRVDRSRARAWGTGETQHSVRAPRNRRVRVSLEVLEECPVAARVSPPSPRLLWSPRRMLRGWIPPSQERTSPLAVTVCLRIHLTSLDRST